MGGWHESSEQSPARINAALILRPGELFNFLVASNLSPSNPCIIAAMCGGFTLTIADRRLVAEMLGVDPDSIPQDYRPRYNIAPTDPHFLVKSRYE
jgi:hypothetical protein